MADYIIKLWNLYQMFWISNAIPYFGLNRKSRSRKVLWSPGISRIDIHWNWKTRGVFIWLRSVYNNVKHTIDFWEQVATT